VNQRQYTRFNPMNTLTLEMRRKGGWRMRMMNSSAKLYTLTKQRLLSFMANQTTTQFH